MKRFLTLVLLLLLVSAGGFPWVTGFIFKRNYLALIDNINAENRIKISVQSYDEGWLHSHVQLQVTPVMKIVSPQDPQYFMSQQVSALSAMSFDQTITHGPWLLDELKGRYSLAIAKIDTQLSLSSPLQAILLGGSKQAAAIISSFVCFDGNWNNQIQTPVFTIPMGGMGSLTWQGISGQTYFKVDDNQIVSSQSKIKIGMISAQGNPGSPLENMQLQVQPISMEGEAHRQPIGLWDVLYQASIPEVLIKDKTGTRLEIQKLAVNGAGATHSDKYSTDFSLSLDKIALPSFPIPEFSQGSLKISVKDLNSQQIKVFSDFIKQNKLDQESREVAAQELQSKILGLLTPTFSWELASSINSSLGAAMLNGNFSWPAKTPLPKTKEELSQANITVDLKIAMPLARKLGELKADMAQTPGQPAAAQANPIDQLVQQGVLIQQGSDYVGTFTFQGGTVLINGKAPQPPTPPPAAVAPGTAPAATPSVAPSTAPSATPTVPVIPAAPVSPSTPAAPATPAAPTQPLNKAAPSSANPAPASSGGDPAVRW